MTHTQPRSPLLSCSPRPRPCVRNVYTKVAAVGILFLFCLSALILPCTAMVASPYNHNTWEMAEDGTWIHYKQITYTYYDAPAEWHILPERALVYDDPIVWNGTEYQVYADKESASILWLLDQETQEILLYTTDTGRLLLEDYAQERNVHYYLAQNITTSRCRRSLLPTTTFETLNHLTSSSAITVDVRDLRTLTRYDILMYDKTEVVYRVCGAIYEKQGGFLYVDYRALNNTYFDADGNFSYRSGHITATSFTAKEGEFLDACMGSMTEFHTKYIYENDNGFTLDEESNVAAQIAVFWVFFVLIGYILPIAPLVVGLIMPRSAKHGYPKRYYVIALLAIVWMCLAGLMTLLLLL